LNLIEFLKKMSVLGIFTFANSDIYQQKMLENKILLDMNEAMAVNSKLSVTLVLIKILVISDEFS